MSKYIRSLVGFAVLLTAISAVAQSAHQAIAVVPFPFVAGGHVCPAGEYRVAIDKANDVVTFTQQGRREALVLGIGGGSSSMDSGTYLRFRRVGEQWFLQDIAVSGVIENLALPKVHTEENEVAQSTQVNALPVSR